MCNNKVLKVIGIVCIVIVGLFVLLAAGANLKRGMQGRIMASSEMMRMDSSSGGMEYEPYYLAQNYAVKSAASSVAGRPVNTIEMPARKLIKRANLNLKVKDCAQVQQEIQGIVAKFSGIIVDSKLNQSSQFLKNGTVIFKVQPKDLEAVLADVKKLGEVESESVTGEDVTEQYVDLQARLKNLVQVKERLLKILNERAREVKDILDIEREMARVGGEIESLEGRIKFLDRQTDLSTVTVYFHEKRLSILKALNFGEKFMNTLRTSVETFVNTFNGIIVVISFLLPILIWVVIIWAIVAFFMRIFRKKG